MNILEEIAAKTIERIRKEKEAIPLSTVRSAAEKRRFGAPDFLFEKALKKPGISFICEVKKASPSKGIIAEDFPYLDIARSYEAAGADAISCLTEPFYFLGRDAYLQEISASVSIPVLRKDFTIDEYMIYQAAAYGASAVLLICSILDDEKLLAYRQLADELKLSALVETHSEEEISRAVKAGARIIGVNNRNLKNFQVDCLCHDMRCGMTECCLSSLIFKGKDIQLAVGIHNRTKVNLLAVDLSGTGSPCQAFADVQCDVINAFCFCVLFFRAVFQCDDHNFPPYKIKSPL